MDPATEWTPHGLTTATNARVISTFHTIDQAENTVVQPLFDYRHAISRQKYFTVSCLSNPAKWQLFCSTGANSPEKSTNDYHRHRYISNKINDNLLGIGVIGRQCTCKVCRWQTWRCKKQKLETSDVKTSIKFVRTLHVWRRRVIRSSVMLR